MRFPVVVPCTEDVVAPPQFGFGKLLAGPPAVKASEPVNQGAAPVVLTVNCERSAGGLKSRYSVKAMVDGAKVGVVPFIA